MSKPTDAETKSDGRALPDLLRKAGGALLPFLPLLLSLAFLWMRGISPYGALQASFWPLVFLLQLWVFLTPFRTLTFGETANGCVVGLTITSHLIYASALLLDKLVQVDAVKDFLRSKSIFGSTNLTDTLVAPLTEEFWKAAVPLLILLLSTSRGTRPMAKLRTPVDFMLLTAASGAGFSIFENLWRVRGSVMEVLWPAFESDVSWVIGPIRLYPEMYANSFYRGDLIWFGHASHAAAVGLAFGIFYHLRRKRWPVLLPIAVWLIAFWDHLLWNYNIPKMKIWWRSTLGWATIHGRLMPFVFAAMLAGAIFLIWRQMRWYCSTRHAERYGVVRLTGPSAVPDWLKRRKHALMAAFGLGNALKDGRKKASTYAPAVSEQIAAASVKARLL